MKPSIPSRLGIISITIIILAIFAMSVIWPMGAFPVNQSSTANLEGARESNPSNEDDFVRQEFSPMYEELQSVSVYLTNDADSVDTMKCVFRLYDYTGTCLLEYFFQLEDVELPGYVKIPAELTLSPGTLYYYTIGGVDGDLYTMYCSDEHKTAENGAMYYKEVPAGGTTLATQYEYRRPMGFKRIMAGYFIIGVMTAGILLVINWLRCKAGSKKYIKIEKIVKIVLSAIIGAGVVATFVGIVVKELFASDLLNISFLMASVVIAAGLLVWGIIHCKSAEMPLEEDEKTLKQKGLDLTRAILFAVCILFICLHNNAMTDYEKGLHMRSMLACLGIILVSYGKKKEIWSLPNLIWSVVAIIFGKYYVSIHSDHIEHINTAVRSAFVIWSMGLVIIHYVYIVMSGRLKKIRNVHVLYTIMVYVFWLACAIMSNNRTWTWVVLVIFTLWNIEYVISDEKIGVLQNICNGVLLAFIGGTIFCLYRRPYLYYIFYRYGGIFYTVTSTAVYLCVPVCAALLKLREKISLSSLIMWGLVAAYMAFTASRTGIIASAVTVLIILLLPGLEHSNRWVLGKLKKVGIIFMATVMGFVMTYGATRMLPAIVGNPYYFFFEQEKVFVDEQTPWAGDGQKAKYITIEKTLETLFGRLFVQASADVETMDVSAGALLASAEDSGEIAVSVEKSDNLDGVVGYSNGRTNIYKEYLNNLNMSGHDSMQLEASDGEVIVHAHNTYLQLAYDFGIPVGILFLLFCLYTFVRSMKLAINSERKSTYNLLPLLIVTIFGVASLFEWTYYPCIPLGFAFLLMLAPLIVKEELHETC